MGTETENKPGKAKTTAKAPGAGPAADDKWTDEAAQDIEARIVGQQETGAVIRVQLAGGRGIATKMKGYIQGGTSTVAVAELEVVGVDKLYAYADVTGATMDEVMKFRNVLVNPSQPPSRKVARPGDLTRVIALTSVDETRTKITIAIGSNHGVRRGMLAKLKPHLGLDAVEFTIEDVTPRNATAIVDASVQHVRRCPEVMLLMSAGAGTTVVARQKREIDEVQKIVTSAAKAQ